MASSSSSAGSASFSVDSLEWRCPLCLKSVARRTIRPRVAHLVQCALIKGRDIEKAKGEAGVDERAWEEYIASQKSASSAVSTVVGVDPAAKKKKAKKSTLTPNTLDASLSSTRGGNGVGTALAHVQRSRLSATAHSATPATAASAAESSWENQNGIFLLGTNFNIPTNAHHNITVEKLEKIAQQALHVDQTTPAAAATTAAAAASSSMVPTISSQLHAWRHYIHEFDSVLLKMQSRRSQCMSTYRRLQELLILHGGILTDDLRMTNDLAHDMERQAALEAQHADETATTAAAAASSTAEAADRRYWNTCASPMSTLPRAPFLNQLPLDNLTARSIPTPTPPPAPIDTTLPPMLPPMQPRAQQSPLPRASSAVTHTTRNPPISDSIVTPSPATSTTPAVPPQTVGRNIWSKSTSTPQPATKPPVSSSPSPSAAAAATRDTNHASSLADLPLSSAFATSVLKIGVASTSTCESVPPCMTPHSDPKSITTSVHESKQQHTIHTGGHDARASPLTRDSTPDSFARRIDAVATPTLLRPSTPLALRPPHTPTTHHAPSNAHTAVPSNPIPTPPTVLFIQPPTPAVVVGSLPNHRPPPLPMPFGLTPDDFLLTPEPNTLDPNTNITHTHGDMDGVELKGLNDTICIPETPASSREHTADINVTIDMTSEHQVTTIGTNHSPIAIDTRNNTPFLHTVASLLAADGEVDGDDSSFPALSPSLDSSQNSQPGLNESHSRQPGCESDRMEKMDQHRPHTHANAPPNSHAAIGRSDTQVGSSHTLPSDSLSARPIIELLSDDEGDASHRLPSHAPALAAASSSSAFHHVSTRKRTPAAGRPLVAHSAPQSMSDDDIADLTHHAASSTSQPPSRISVFHTPVTPVEQRTMFGSVIAAPTHWQPTSSRKILAERSLSAASPVATIPPPQPHTPIATSSTNIVAAAPCPIADQPDQPPAKRPRRPKTPVMAAPPAVAAIEPGAAHSSPSSSSRSCSFALGSPGSMVSAFGSCCMPPFDSFALSDLKHIMDGFGLKTKSKNQMTIKLKELWTIMANKKGITLVAEPHPAEPAAHAPKRSKKAHGGVSSASSSPAASSSSRPHSPQRDSDSTIRLPPTIDECTRAVEAATKTNKRKAQRGEPSPTPTDGVTLPPAVGSSFPSGLVDHVRTFIRGQSDLFVRILLFQPIDILELAFLMHDLGGVKVHPKVLRDILDEEGICNTWNIETRTQNENGRGAGRTRTKKTNKKARHTQTQRSNV